MGCRPTRPSPFEPARQRHIAWATGRTDRAIHAWRPRKRDDRRSQQQSKGTHSRGPPARSVRPVQARRRSRGLASRSVGLGLYIVSELVRGHRGRSPSFRPRTSPGSRSDTYPEIDRLGDTGCPSARSRLPGSPVLPANVATTISSSVGLDRLGDMGLKASEHGARAVFHARIRREGGGRDRPVLGQRPDLANEAVAVFVGIPMSLTRTWAAPSISASASRAEPTASTSAP